MIGIINVAKEEAARDQTLAELWKNGSDDERRSFFAGLGGRTDSLPTFTGKSERSHQILDGHAVDDLMREAIVRCSIVAPQELQDCADFVKMHEQAGAGDLDWGMRFDLMIPALIHTYVRWKTGDKEFWREKKHVQAFIRAFPAARAHYESKVFSMQGGPK